MASNMQVTTGLHNTEIVRKAITKAVTLEGSSVQQLITEMRGRMSEQEDQNVQFCFTNNATLGMQLVRPRTFNSDKFITLNDARVQADNVALAITNTLVQVPQKCTVTQQGNVSAHVPCLFITRNAWNAVKYIEICAQLNSLIRLASTRRCGYYKSTDGINDTLSAALYFQQLFNDGLLTVQPYAVLRTSREGVYTSVVAYSGDTLTSTRAIYTFIWEVLQLLLENCPEESLGWYILNTPLSSVLESNLQYNNSNAPMLSPWSVQQELSEVFGSTGWNCWNMEAFLHRVIVTPLRYNYNIRIPGWSTLLLPLARKEDASAEPLTFVASVLTYDSDDDDDEIGAKERLILCKINVNFTTGGLGYTLTALTDAPLIYEINSYAQIALVSVSSSINVGGLFDQNGVLLPTFGQGCAYVSTLVRTLQQDPAYRQFMQTKDRHLRVSNGVRSWDTLTQGSQSFRYTSPSYFQIDTAVKTLNLEYGAYINTLPIRGSGVGYARAIKSCKIYVLTVANTQYVVVSEQAPLFETGQVQGAQTGHFAINTDAFSATPTVVVGRGISIRFAVATSSSAWIGWYYANCDVFETTQTGGRQLTPTTTSRPDSYWSDMYVLDNGTTLYAMAAQGLAQAPLVAQLVYGQNTSIAQHTGSLSVTDCQNLACLDIRSWMKIC